MLRVGSAKVPQGWISVCNIKLQNLWAKYRDQSDVSSPVRRVMSNHNLDSSVQAFSLCQSVLKCQGLQNT